MGVMYMMIVAILVIRVHSHRSEMKCSAFEYELQTLRTVLNMEHEMVEFKAKMKSWQEMLEATFEKYATIEQKRENRSEEMLTTLATLQEETTQATQDMKLQIKNSQQDIARQLQEEMSTTLAGFNSTMEDFLTEQATIAANRGQQVAFTVHSPARTLVGGITPTFSIIVMNMGGGYNTTTGKFHSPVSGVYSFSMTISAKSSRTGRNHVYCYIRKNSSSVVLVQTYEGKYDSASGSIFIHLSVGDIVDLYCGNTYWNYAQTNDYTSFTGSLIRAD